MTKITTILFFLGFLSFQTTIAQNIKDETIEYRYIKLPLTPVAKTIKNYKSTIVAPFEVENQKKRDKHEADIKKAEEIFQQDKANYPAKVKAAEEAYKLEMADYPAKVKANDDQYNAELAEYNKKSLATKLLEKEVLNENGKPYKKQISAPYVHTPQEPTLRTVYQPVFADSYDYSALASTYLALDGFEKNDENAVKIEVTINGFEYTPAKQVTVTKSVASTVNGVTSNKNVNYYHIEFTYRHTMSVKVTTPTGTEVFYITPSELNTYKIYKSPESTTAQPLNEEQLKSTYKEKILQENLTFINNLVNDKVGFKRESRKSLLYYIKTKDDIYSDLMLAYNDGTSALKNLIDDTEGSTAKLDNAIQNWTKALQESDLNNKKARIDKDVTLIIYFNLLEAYFVKRDIENAEKIINTLNMSSSLSNSEKKIKEEYITLFSDLKKRITANK
jgi:hypothetical protein